MKRLITSLAAAISLTAFNTASHANPALIATAAIGTATLCCSKDIDLPTPVKFIAYPAAVATVIPAAITYSVGVTLPVEVLRFISAPIRPLLAEHGDTTPFRTPQPRQYQTLAVFDGAYIGIDQSGALIRWELNQTKPKDKESQPRIIPIPDTRNFIEIASGGNHLLALNKDGTVWSMGQNDAYQLGYEIDEIILPNQQPARKQASPRQIPGLSNIISIAAYNNVSIALARDGAIYAFGAYKPQPQRQCPCCSASVFEPPVQINSVAGAQQIILDDKQGYYWAIMPDQQSLRWSLDSSIPASGRAETIAPESPIVQIHHRNEGMDLLLADGSVWSGGANYSGQLGQGDYQPHSGLQKVKNIGHITSMACNYTHCSALDDQGRIWQWGNFLYKNSWWKDQSQRFYNPYPAVVLRKKGLKSLWSDGNKLFGVNQDGSISVLAD